MRDIINSTHSGEHESCFYFIEEEAAVGFFLHKNKLSNFYISHNYFFLKTAQKRTLDKKIILKI